MFELGWDQRCKVLLDSVRTGEPALFGRRGFYGSVQSADWLCRLVTGSMHARSLPLARTLAQLVELPPRGHLLDVGCGSGVFAVEVLRRHPAWRATLLDLPPVVRLAEQWVSAADLTDRVSLVGADMFDATWPTADAVLIADVLHNWDTARCEALLRRASACLAPGGWVLVHEMLLDTPPVEPARAANSVCMVATTGGRQRCSATIDAWLGSAGFGPARTQPTSHYYSVIMAQTRNQTGKESTYVQG
jgi:acetylserotonin N-methyltransferase